MPLRVVLLTFGTARVQQTEVTSRHGIPGATTVATHRFRRGKMDPGLEGSGRCTRSARVVSKTR